MATNYIGQAVKRREDLRFITGAGQYTDDVALPGQTFAYFIRSPHAHAKIKSIRKDKALEARRASSRSSPATTPRPSTACPAAG